MRVSSRSKKDDETRRCRKRVVHLVGTRQCLDDAREGHCNARGVR